MDIALKSGHFKGPFKGFEGALRTLVALGGMEKNGVFIRYPSEIPLCMYFVRKVRGIIIPIFQSSGSAASGLRLQGCTSEDSACYCIFRRPSL